MEEIKKRKKDTAEVYNSKKCDWGKKAQKLNLISYANKINKYNRGRKKKKKKKEKNPKESTEQIKK